MSALQKYIQSGKLPMLGLLETLPYGVIIADKMGIIVFWNKGAESQFLYTKDETIGYNLTMLMPDRFIAAHTTAFRETRQSPDSVAVVLGTKAELFAKRKDNTEFPVEISVIADKLNGIDCYLAVVADMTDRDMLKSAQMVSSLLTIITNNREQAALEASLVLETSSSSSGVEPVVTEVIESSSSSSKEPEIVIDIPRTV